MTPLLMMTLLTLLTLIMTSTPAIVPDGQGIHHQIQHPPLSVKTQHSLAQARPPCKAFYDPCSTTSECCDPLVCRKSVYDPVPPQTQEENIPRCRYNLKDIELPGCHNCG